ncbi:DNA packaging protein [Oceanobacillus sp. CAU 1775]
MVALTTKQKLKKITQSFELFAKNFIYIVNTQNETVPMKLNLAQQELTELMDSNRYTIINKARRAGISTLMLAKALFEAVTKENQSIIIVSYEGDSAKALFNILKSMNDNLPRDKYPDLFAETRRDNKSELLFWNGSRIVSTVAGYKDIGRGMSITWAHLSEFAFWNGSQEEQLLSIEQALVDNGRISIETTSNGIGNYYYELYQKAKRGNSKYKSYFVPWYHPFYRESKKGEYDEAEQWYRAKYGKRLAKRDLEGDDKRLHEQGADLRQLMWRDYKLQDMKIEEFFQEFPSNDMQSFISTNKSVFSQEKVLERIDYVMPDIPLKELDVVPDSLQKYIGKELKIFHEFNPKIKYYYAGVDVAHGSGNGDASTITIINEEGVEVASFGSNKLPVYQFVDVLYDLLMWYGQPMCAIERNNVGIVAIEKLRDEYHYMNLYKEKLFDQKGKRRSQLGFTTSHTSKPVLLEKFKEAFELGYILINDVETLQQMQIYQNVNNKMGNKQGEGNHDDKVISAALANLAKDSNKWYI